MADSDVSNYGLLLEASFLLGFMYGFLRAAWSDFCDWRTGRRAVEYHNVDGDRIKTWRENGDWFARKVN